MTSTTTFVIRDFQVQKKANAVFTDFLKFFLKNIDEPRNHRFTV